MIFLCLIGALDTPIGSMPALGRLLNPFQGVYQNQRLDKESQRKVLIEGLTGPVRVVFDKAQVPHIFARSSADAFRVQGYLVAQDRLFQMDVQTRAGAGTLSEIFGARTDATDSFFIRLGLRKAARLALKEMNEDSLTREALEAYASGVNIFISSLRDQDLPVEYKILGVRPAMWTPERSAQLLKIMAFRLNGLSDDLFFTELARKLGPKMVDKLFPTRFGDEVFFKKDRLIGNLKGPSDFFLTSFTPIPEWLKPFRREGSNNWAVAPKASATQRTLLANDPHLALSLPAIWYENHIVTPDMNVYGVSFPGAPGVVIGFNRSIAWGVTNATTDVLDFYEEEFDENSLHTRRGEGFAPVEIEKEVLNVRGAAPQTIEVLWTRHGPTIARLGRLGLSVQWTSHLPSNEIKTFLKLNLAKNFAECKEALSYYKAPAQNFICADSENIGIFHQGLFPKRWPGQGRYVLDGRRTDHDWQGFLNENEIPNLEGLQTTLVFSANQRVVDSDLEMGVDYFESFRAQRIRELLAQKQKLTLEDMTRFQTDTYDLQAKQALPVLFKYLKMEGRSPEELKVLEELKGWDYQMKASSKDAIIYREWWKNLEKRLYGEWLKVEKDHAPLKPQPSVTLQILENPLAFGLSMESEDLVSESLDEALKTSGKNLGTSRPTEFPHVAKLPGFGETLFAVDGSPYTLVQNTGRLAPVWRMAVELGNPPKARVSLAGGPSGNPFDPSYTLGLKDWAGGKYREAFYPERFDSSFDKYWEFISTK